MCVWICFGLFQSAEAQGPFYYGFETTSFPSEVIGVFDGAPTEPPTTHTALKKTAVQNLLELEQKVHALVPDVQACVVSVEGGTGFVISETGLIITASHITKRAGRKVAVQFPDGKKYQAVTLGSNRANDTGALQLVNKGPWRHLVVADSLEPELGQWCVTFGYPLSFPRGAPATVRFGQITGISDKRIITDCPIMGGDSGGPLVNLDGKVIGINTGVTTKITQNLHVPFSAFEEDKQDIMASSDVIKTRTNIRKVYFGVLGETDRNRVRIRKVFKDSPAEKAGIRKDDVITQLDNVQLDSFTDFLNFLASHQPDDRVIARVNRFGQVLNLQVYLGQR